MKMGFINSGAFWGIIIILLGVSMVLRYVFNIHFPIFRIVFACLLIFWGVKMLMGSFGYSRWHDNTAIFSETKYNYDKSNNSYSVIFGSGELDLRNISLDKNKRIHINSVFGSYVVKTNDSIPIMIVSNVAFGNIQTPDDNDTSFGKYTYRSSNYSDETPHIIIDANIVFGDLKVVKD